SQMQLPQNPAAALLNNPALKNITQLLLGALGNNSQAGDDKNNISTIMQNLIKQIQSKSLPPGINPATIIATLSALSPALAAQSKMQQTQQSSSNNASTSSSASKNMTG